MSERGRGDDFDGIEVDWEELDWEELGFEPEDGDRVRDAWHKFSERYEGRGDLGSLVRFVELVGEVAGDALPPDARRQLERLLREFLVVVRDVADRVIERLDESENDFEIEEIPID